ncbi:MAG: lipid-A-disaccharide synthase N-terminal domain-containing protein [Paludisphaera borealis]|uniref:lipid-A-disaccharide synthase N-terminal domain-containing protein n=1 Tax=Paludisphaera borealis TaxID=1387353 RepID=UPI00284E0AB6|nr:lipid-A-disaccharide synthase N-terminal domain-containing protein [Paludisphaera borealis]MDR3618272.1 lipid-A-disaccharide synthase N-terminal domain-containing protein [Paludisphaera borealis]
MSSFSFWLTVGFVGQGFFTARFLVQWLASEKERAVVVPSAFWWLSIVGGAALLSYAVHRRDPVIIVGQSMGLFVYARNLMLEEKRRKRAQAPIGPPVPHFHAADRGEHEVSLATRGPRDDRADGSARM